MVKFLEKLFGKKEPELFTISMDAIPAWLDEREREARTLLQEETAEPRRRIRDATRNLAGIIALFAQAERDEKVHPKLKAIAKNSLPQFVRSMNASLGKELPEDIEEFYTAAAECIRSCLNSIRGPGRYLQVVFPDEMKSVRSGVDSIGREINAVTLSLGRFRREQEQISSARTLRAALLDVSADLQGGEEKDLRINGRLREISDRISAIGTELQVLSEDPRREEIRELENRVREADDQLDSAARLNAALSMTASHVFRKAEKIATRQKHPSEIAVLRHATELLSDHALPDPAALSPVLAAACPVAERMIAEGDIVLKNREERAIFSETEKFCSTICCSYADLGRAEDSARMARANLAAHPLITRVQALEREKTQLCSMQKKEEQAQAELADWMGKTREKIPELTEELRKKMEELKGGAVQLRTGDPGPA